MFRNQAVDNSCQISEIRGGSVVPQVAGNWTSGWSLGMFFCRDLNLLVWLRGNVHGILIIFFGARARVCSVREYDVVVAWCVCVMTGTKRTKVLWLC